MLDGTNVAVITSFVIALLFNNSYSSKMLNLCPERHSPKERAGRNIFILKCCSNVSKILNRLFCCFVQWMASSEVVNDYNERPLRVGPCQNRLRCSTVSPEHYLHQTGLKTIDFHFSFDYRSPIFPVEPVPFIHRSTHICSLTFWCLSLNQIQFNFLVYRICNERVTWKLDIFQKRKRKIVNAPEAIMLDR